MAAISFIDYLISAQHQSGGWGYKTGHKPVVEATSTVLLALRDDPLASDSYGRGVTWLMNCQHEDGGWGINEDDPESGWQTAWALLALIKSTQGKERINKAVAWLSAVATYSVSTEEFQMAEFPHRDNVEALVWPWLPGQVGWLEPTALAVIALNQAIGTPLVAERIKIALDYFIRYRAPDGGWNIGNTSPLDTIIIPRVYQTVLVLIALADIAPQYIQPGDVNALQQDLTRDPGMLAQAAGLFGLKTRGVNHDATLSYLSANQLPDGSWEHSPFVTAWSILGLRGYL